MHGHARRLWGVSSRRDGFLTNHAVAPFRTPVEVKEGGNARPLLLAAWIASAIGLGNSVGCDQVQAHRDRLPWLNMEAVGSNQSRHNWVLDMP